jgi:uncharacterized protein YgiB involved in biofilm formation
MRRRSTNVRLIAMGTVILGGCGPNVPSDRYVYHSNTECVRDWGDTNCDRSAASHGGGGGSYFYGPRYDSSVRLPSGQTVWTGNAQQHALHPASGKVLGQNSVAVSRGGFGSLSRSFGSIGS